MPYKDEEKRKEYNQEYYQKNKDRVLAQKKEYYQQHKENINEKVREYQRQNKDSIKKREAEYRQKNKERYNEWYTKNKDRHLNVVKRNHKKANDKSKLTAHNDNTTWRFEEKCMLQILKAEGVPNSQAALLLGRTIKSVDNMVYRIKHQNALNKNLSGKQDLKAMEELQDLIELYHINSSLGGD